MAQPWAEWFYLSKAWTDCRLAFMASKFFICERCGGAEGDSSRVKLDVPGSETAEVVKLLLLRGKAFRVTVEEI